MRRRRGRCELDTDTAILGAREREVDRDTYRSIFCRRLKIRAEDAMLMARVDRKRVSTVSKKRGEREGDRDRDR